MNLYLMNLRLMNLCLLKLSLINLLLKIIVHFAQKGADQFCYYDYLSTIPFLWKEIYDMIITSDIEVYEKY